MSSLAVVACFAALQRCAFFDGDIWETFVTSCSAGTKAAGMSKELTLSAGCCLARQSEAMTEGQRSIKQA